MPDINWKSYYGNNPDTSEFVNPENHQDYDDIMKFSNCTNVMVTDKIIAPGRENCVDVTHGKNYIWDKNESTLGGVIVQSMFVFFLILNIKLLNNNKYEPRKKHYY